MAKDSSNRNIDPAADPGAQQRAEAALLQQILDGEPSVPWLATEQADEYDTGAEAAGQALEISDEEVARGWQGLSAQLSELWSAPTVGVAALVQQKFASRVPLTVLSAIAEKAQQAVNSGQPMVDQMIGCVRDTFAQMAEADLQVMARPMAFAMRGSSADEFVDATMQSVPQTEWDSLSPVERARLGLAAARYAISQAEAQS